MPDDLTIADLGLETDFEFMHAAFLLIEERSTLRQEQHEETSAEAQWAMEVEIEMLSGTILSLLHRRASMPLNERHARLLVRRSGEYAAKVARLESHVQGLLETSSAV